MSTPGSSAARSDLLARLRALEDEVARLHTLAATQAAGERLPGAYLVLEAAGQRALVPGAHVREVVRLVETTPQPLAPEPVLGTFVHRGAAVVAIDLARWLGTAREPAIDAHLVVFGASRAFALLVDRVVTVVDEPEVAGAGVDAASQWEGAGLVASWCRAGDALLPLLRLGPFLAMVAEHGA